MCRSPLLIAVSPPIVRSHVAIPSDSRPKFLDEFIYHKYWENRTVISSPRALLHGVLEAHQLVGDEIDTTPYPLVGIRSVKCCPHWRHSILGSCRDA